MVRRSVLFSPGDQPALLRKAPESGADVVVFDLEDAVAPEQKDNARERIRTVLGESEPDCKRCVRINPLDSGGRADLDALEGEWDNVDSLMLPKVSGSDAVATLQAAFEDRGIAPPVLALLETADGILGAEAVADRPEVDALLLGAEDLAADIGATRTDNGREVSYARQQVVLAASSAGVAAIDTLVTDFERTAYLESETKRAVQFGFDGKMAIHPAQIPVINDGFTPSEEELNWARRVLEKKQEADRAGDGVFAVDGEMIDAPLIAQAEQLLDRAEAAGLGEE